MKKFHSVCNISKQKDNDILFNSIEDLKADYKQKFKIAIAENFTRAFTLIKNIEKNAEINGQFEKENIVNAHIIEHLVDYIKKMSQSFTDLYDDFYSENDEDFYSSNDKLITEIRAIFSGEIISNYFLMIFTKLEQVLSNLKNFNSSNEKLLIQKFFYFYYILYKMNDDVFISFINSQINYLVGTDLYIQINQKMSHFLGMFYSILLDRISLKVLLVNKDEFKYYNDYIEGLIKQVKFFFANENYNSNRAYEKPIVKFIIFLYSLSTVLLLMMNSETDFESYDLLLQEFTNVSGIFFRLNSLDFILQLHECSKMLSKMSLVEDLNAIFNKETCTPLKIFLFQLRKVSLNDMAIVKFCSEKKISLEQFAKYAGLILLKFLRLSCDEIKDDSAVIRIEEIENFINKY